MAIPLQPGSGGTQVHLLSPRERPEALAFLGRAPREHLPLLDLVAHLGSRPAPSEVAAQLLGAWRDGRLAGLLSLRPSVMIDSSMDESLLDAFDPYLATLESGLVKSAEHVVDPFWRRLAKRGRKALIDRREFAHCLTRQRAELVDPPPAATLRRARSRDLEALVFAARASLREEDRPDPFEGDPAGFRRWVQGRLGRARVIEVDGRVVFVGYADVRRSEGWLIQGVYTWPEARRRGWATLGMSGLIREAFQSGAEHVQLAVIDGNRAAIGLYRRLGFQPYERLRTILFG